MQMNERFRSLLPTLGLTAAVLSLTALYIASIGPYWNISPDSATYVGWGRSLATGSGWTEVPMTPPVPSFFFAAAFRLFGGGYFALNAVTVLLILSAVAISYRLIERESGRTFALLVVLLSLSSARLISESTQLLSEPSYLLFTFASLWFLDQPVNEERSAPSAAAARARRLWEVAGGLCLVLSVLSRYIGITLALAVLVVEAHAWITRARRPRPMVILFAVVALCAQPAWNAIADESYFTGIFRTFTKLEPNAPSSASLSLIDLVRRMVWNLREVPTPGLLLVNSRSNGLLWLLLNAAGTLAFIASLIAVLLRRITITRLYVLIYVVAVSVVMLVGGWNDSRYLIPVLPFLFYYPLETLRWLINRPTRPGFLRWGTAAAAGLYVLWFLNGGLRTATESARNAHTSPFGAYPIKRPNNFDLQRLAMWIRDSSEAGARYAAGQRDMLDVITERRGVSLVAAVTSPHAEFIARLRREDVRYLLVDHRGGRLTDSLRVVIREFPDTFRLISELPRASLYAVDWSRN